MRAAKIAALVAVAILALTYSVRAGIEEIHTVQVRHEHYGVFTGGVVIRLSYAERLSRCRSGRLQGWRWRAANCHVFAGRYIPN